MQETSALYKKIISDTHWFETSLVIGDSGVLITESADRILFGGFAILVARSGADAGYGDSQLVSMTISNQTFSDDTPAVGCCVSGEIEVEMYKPAADFPTMAQLVPYVRVTNGEETSEWIKKGVYYIDTRESNKDDAGLTILTIHGYDAILKSETDYTGANLTWPSTDIKVVKDIASLMGVSVDSDTVALMSKGYTIQLPSGYSQREVLGYIAGMYAGNFIMSDVGELKLVQLNGMPKESNYLLDSAGYVVTFGGDRILI